jgi:hypothetical protein
MSKPRYTVAKPPRVYEVAAISGYKSSHILRRLWQMGCDVKSASSRIPLPIYVRLWEEYTLDVYYNGCEDCAKGVHGRLEEGRGDNLEICACCRIIINDPEGALL